MFTLHDKRINIYAPFTAEDGTRYGDLTNPEVREALGVVEISDPTPPEDYSDETYYRTEQDDAPYVVFTRKPDEQIKAIMAAKVQAQIDALEAQAMLPRVTREFMLLSFATTAAGMGVDPMTNIAYKKVKALYDQIAALRSQW